MPAVAAEFAIPVQLHLKDGARERLDGHITRVSSGFMVVACRLAVDASRKLEVFYLGRGIFCEAVYCHPEPDGSYRIGIRLLEDTNGALRAERRIRLDAPAELTTPGIARPLAVRVMDMSSSGLGIKLEAPLAVGQAVYVELEHGVAFGEIRHCKPIAGGYRAGAFVEEFIPRGGAAPNRGAATQAKGESRVTMALRTALMPRKAS